MPVYLPPEPPRLWQPPRPAIIRHASDLVRPDLAMLPGMAPVTVRRKWPGKSAYELTGLLGLRSGLKLCLDAGDSASYTSGQPWLDRSGNGYDFNRGATSSSEASDPTFNGTAGNLSASEYFSWDSSGDYFTYDSANEAAFENIHKAGAKFGILSWLYVPAGSGTRLICGTRQANPANIGFDVLLNTSDVLTFVVSKGGSNALTFSGGTITEATWQCVAVAGDEAAGAFLGMINGAVTLGGSTYSSPSSSAATYTLQIGSGGAGTNTLQNTSRMAQFLLWEGVTPSLGQLMAYFQGSRTRFGV